MDRATQTNEKRIEQYIVPNHLWRCFSPSFMKNLIFNPEAKLALL